MVTGILICGLNGCGKSTLGKALAERMGLHFIDIEHLYFYDFHTDTPYANPKSRAEVEQLLMDEVRNHPDFIFSAVKGNYGKEIVSMYNYIILIQVPKEIRNQRVRNRSFLKFGNRMLEGGDLFEQEESFFRMADSRQDSYVESWLETVSCPIMKVDGTKPIEDNIESILQMIRR